MTKPEVEMIRQTDDLMYAAKRSGKDMVKHVEFGLAPTEKRGS
jgi:PleD family two-component response regulator